ncbi:acyltransferase [Chlorogloea sp. CCALA 695]|uniref:acyltransferase n=1 Tax=Chlorogloea sp. CCALA 695 TaxID=2107693 RepID=UPI0018ED85FF|nr:acyltransferase [Chlorogloea sp. CCALA 695]
MMDNQNNRANLTVQFSNLPLAVYREIAAHLCQVEEVETKLLQASTPEFNYNDSQVESLQIQLPAANKQSREQVEEILAYYQNIFGAIARF